MESSAAHSLCKRSVVFHTNTVMHNATTIPIHTRLAIVLSAPVSGVVLHHRENAVISECADVYVARGLVCIQAPPLPRSPSHVVNAHHQACDLRRRGTPPHLLRGNGKTGGVSGFSKNLLCGSLSECWAPVQCVFLNSSNNTCCSNYTCCENFIRLGLGTASLARVLSYADARRREEWICDKLRHV